MPDLPHDLRHAGPSRRRVDIILELIDKALADCEPQLVQLRTAVVNGWIPR
jgi:hypothetical protein